MNNNVNLWGEEFAVNADSLSLTKKLLKKTKPKVVKEITLEKQLSSKKVSLEDKMVLIKDEIERILGHYKNDTLVITTQEALLAYIEKANENALIAIDTETDNSLDPLTCRLMGLCLYTPGEKQCYVPINHIDISSGERLKTQLGESNVREALLRVIGKSNEILMHNGSFDYRVLKCTCDVEIPPTWDTMICARLLDENEMSAGLKQQYIDKIDSDQEKYSLDKLFNEIPYAVADPSLFALYAATDPYMTYKLYEWQKRKFEDPDLAKIYKLFRDVEMPIVQVSAEMELRGICLDLEYAERLRKKYQKKSEDLDKEMQAQMERLRPTIEKWKASPEGNVFSGKKKLRDKLEDPISFSSPTQLSILIYDILKDPVVNRKAPRGTGAGELELLYKKTKRPLYKLVVEKRGVEKLRGTYIEKLPKSLSVKDGRLHGEFKQVGTDTGRFSSSNPNLQNIPSHAKDIRLMFKATPGYKLVGADFSQAEPRLLAFYSQDKQMIQAYLDKKDLYATVASSVFNNHYEDNLEFNPDGTVNYAGKERRTFCKSVILGIMYGRGASSIAEQVGKTTEEAQDIINRFYAGFPKAKEWTDKTQEDCKRLGYVEDFLGRRRRLPDIQLPEYTVKVTDKTAAFNPLIGAVKRGDAVSEQKKAYYEQRVKGLKTRDDYENLKREAFTRGVAVNSNLPFIKQAERQGVNARIQGGSASITKRAMLLVYRDELMNRLGFKILLCIHDEIIGECPEENAEIAGKRLTELMIEAPKPECDMPFKCDYDIMNNWYETEYKAMIQEEFESNGSDFHALCENHRENLPQRLREIINEKDS